MRDDFDLIIKPNRHKKDYIKDIYRYRDLLLILTWRDILVRYKQTIMGIAWAFIRPLLTMAIFTILFGKIAKLENDTGAPYAIVVFAALLPWQLFANGFAACSNSLVAGAGMLSKVYFPRLILPISSILTATVDFIISFIILLLLSLYFNYVPSINIIYLPFFLFLLFTTVFATGIWIAALNVEYRDFKHITPFIVQFGLYVSPVGFMSSVIPDKYIYLYNLNPLVGLIDGFRWCILGYGELNVLSLAMSIFVTLILLSYSLKRFMNLERTFADKI